jgi:hypothetical protein
MLASTDQVCLQAAPNKLGEGCVKCFHLDVCRWSEFPGEKLMLKDKGLGMFVQSKKGVSAKMTDWLVWIR